MERVREEERQIKWFDQNGSAIEAIDQLFRSWWFAFRSQIILFLLFHVCVRCVLYLDATHACVCVCMFYQFIDRFNLQQNGLCVCARREREPRDSPNRIWQPQIAEGVDKYLITRFDPRERAPRASAKCQKWNLDLMYSDGPGLIRNILEISRRFYWFVIFIMSGPSEWVSETGVFDIT